MSTVDLVYSKIGLDYFPPFNFINALRFNHWILRDVFTRFPSYPPINHFAGSH